MPFLPSPTLALAVRRSRKKGRGFPFLSRVHYAFSPFFPMSPQGEKAKSVRMRPPLPCFGPFPFLP